MKSIKDNIKYQLNNLEVGDKIDKGELMNKVYCDKNANLDYFKKRSFDVALCNAKKELKDKEFNSRINNEVIRIK